MTAVILPDGGALELARYFTYAGLAGQLERIVAAYPDLARLESTGRSHRGREIWLVRLINFATGSDRERPAFLIDANNHGEEVVTSAAALYTIAYALSRHGQNPAVVAVSSPRGGAHQATISLDARAA